MGDLKNVSSYFSSLYTTSFHFSVYQTSFCDNRIFVRIKCRTMKWFYVCLCGYLTLTHWEEGNSFFLLHYFFSFFRIHSSFVCNLFIYTLTHTHTRTRHTKTTFFCVCMHIRKLIFFCLHYLVLYIFPHLLGKTFYFSLYHFLIFVFIHCVVYTVQYKKLITCCLVYTNIPAKMGNKCERLCCCFCTHIRTEYNRKEEFIL